MKSITFKKFKINKVMIQYQENGEIKQLSTFWSMWKRSKDIDNQIKECDPQIMFLHNNNPVKLK